MLINIAHSLIGFISLAAITWLANVNRPPVKIRQVLAATLLKIPSSTSFFTTPNRTIPALQQSTYSGPSFVFGRTESPATHFVKSAPGASFILLYGPALPAITWQLKMPAARVSSRSFSAHKNNIYYNFKWLANES